MSNSSNVKQRKLPVGNLQQEKYGNDPGIDWSYQQPVLPSSGPAKSEIELALPGAANKIMNRIADPVKKNS